MVGSASIPRNRRGVLTTFVNHALASNKVIVAAAGVNNKIRVTSVFLTAEAANAIRFTSNGVAISADIYPAATGGFVLIPNPNGWFTTNANEALGIELDGADNIGVTINYQITQV